MVYLSNAIKQISTLMRSFPLMLILCIMLMIINSSCSSDDDAPSRSGSNTYLNAGKFINSDGQTILLTSIGGRPFTYDTNNCITTYTVNNTIFTFKSDPLEIRFQNGTLNGGYFNIKINNKGYIVDMNTKCKSGDDYERRGKVNALYDNEGHITHLTYKDTIYSSNSHSVKEYIFGWNQKRLASITYVDQEDVTTSTVVYNYLYAANKYTNYTKQWTPEEFGDLMWDKNVGDFKFLFYLGCFGIAGEYLPTSYSFTITSTNYTYNKDTNYTFNGDGSVKTAGNYAFSYQK